MAFQDDEREIDARKLFKLKKPETGRSGTDAILELDEDNIQFELKTVGRNPEINNINIFISENYLKELQTNNEIDSVQTVIKEIAENLNNNKIIVIKSTVPVGTANNLKDMINQAYYWFLSYKKLEICCCRLSYH